MSEEILGQNEVVGDELVVEVGAEKARSEDVVEDMGVGAEAMSVIEDEWECGENELSEEEWASIRELLAKEPSTKVFAELVEFFIEGDVGEIVYDYVEEHLEEWPDNVKKWPIKYNDLVLQGRKLRVMKWMRSLFFYGCDKLENVDLLSGLTQLKILHLNGCVSLKNVDGLSGLTGLESFCLSGCKSLEDLNGVRDLTLLYSLDLSECESLENVDALSGLTRIRSLCLSGCKSLEDLNGLSGLNQLGRLNLNGCVSLKNVDGLSSLNQLGRLNFKNCESLENVDALSGLNQLTELSFENCVSLKNVDALSGLTALESLELSGCPDLNLSEEQIEMFEQQMGMKFDLVSIAQRADERERRRLNSRRRYTTASRVFGGKW